ncbi:MAG TPA: hypothetical protein VGE89_12645 [Bryobacteraceae bacterium]|jgi:hypothetical protein
MTEIIVREQALARSQMQHRRLPFREEVTVQDEACIVVLRQPLSVHLLMLGPVEPWQFMRDLRIDALFFIRFRWHHDAL